jgi:hypothetical protein
MVGLEVGSQFMVIERFVSIRNLYIYENNDGPKRSEKIG